MTYITNTTTLPEFAWQFYNVLPAPFCEKLIELFKSGHHDHWDRDGAPKFTQVNVNQDYPDMVGPLVTFTKRALRLYENHFPEARHLPPLKHLEQFRIKRYNSGSGDRYDEHIDVEGVTSSRRYLSFLFYLNDDFTGGQTRFSQGGLVTPCRGSVLVFPPYWMFPHAGLPVEQGTKYIMSTYMHLE